MKKINIFYMFFCLLIFLTLFMALYPHPGEPADTWKFMAGHPHFWRIVDMMGSFCASLYITHLIYEDLKRR